MNMVANRFQRGSGCYNCGSCGRKTRGTGRGDNELTGMCVECYEIGGIENQIADNSTDPDVPKWRAEIAALEAECRKKGGKL